MSTLYSDLQNKFPAEVDDFAKFTDPSISQVSLINQYYAYMEAGNVSAAAQILEQNPALKTSILNAERLNMMRDGLISLERFYLNDVQQYLVEIVKQKGNWSSSVKYTKYDVVMYDGKAYMGISTDIPLGTLPTSTSYFIPLTIQGEQGASGTGLSPRGEWSASITYSVYDCVSYQNGLWYAKTASTNKNPADNLSDWGYIEVIKRLVISSASQPSNQAPGDVWIKEIGGTS